MKQQLTGKSEWMKCLLIALEAICFIGLFVMLMVHINKDALYVSGQDFEFVSMETGNVHAATISLSKGNYEVAAWYQLPSGHPGVLSMTEQPGDKEPRFHNLLAGALSLQPDLEKSAMDIYAKGECKNVSIYVTLPDDGGLDHISVRPIAEGHIARIILLLLLSAIVDLLCLSSKVRTAVMRTKLWIPILVGLLASIPLMTDYMGGEKAMVWVSSVERLRNVIRPEVFDIKMLPALLIRFMGWNPTLSMQLGLIFWNCMVAVCIFATVQRFYSRDVDGILASAGYLAAPWRMTLLYVEGDLHTAWIPMITTVVVIVLLLFLLHRKKAGAEVKWLICILVILWALYMESNIMVSQDILNRIYSGGDALNIHI